MTHNLETAIRLAGAGITVFPVGSDREPAMRLDRRGRCMWKAEASKDPVAVEALWARYGADCLPAIHCGASGLVVIDLDSPRVQVDSAGNPKLDGDGKPLLSPDGVGGFDALLLERGEGVPDCVLVETPSGGWHLYFSGARGCSRGAMPAGIDVRGDGGYVLSPGAIKDDGCFYAIAAGWPDLVEAFTAGTVPAIPGWIIGLIEAPRFTRPPDAAGEMNENVCTDDFRLRQWALGALAGESSELARTPKGRRGSQLNRSVFKLARKGDVLSEGEVWRAISAACATNGLFDEDGFNIVLKSFKKAWADGKRSAPSMPRERY
jgi:hypothetical protein